MIVIKKNLSHRTIKDYRFPQHDRSISLRILEDICIDYIYSDQCNHHFDNAVDGNIYLKFCTEILIWDYENYCQRETFIVEINET